MTGLNMEDIEGKEKGQTREEWIESEMARKEENILW
jgi:hypothetical protein